MKTLEQLRAELQKALGALDTFEKGIVDDAGNARDMTADEVDQMDGLVKAVETASKAVAAKENADRARAAHGVPATGETGTVPATPKKDDKPFKSFGEQLSAIAGAGMNKGMPMDNRLQWRAPSGANASGPADGGFLIQTDFSMALLDQMNEMGQLISRIRKIPISSGANGIMLPTVDETSRAAGSRWGGVRGYWVNEAAEITSSRPKFRQIELKLNKLAALGYATSELLEDAVAMQAIFQQAFAEEMVFNVEDAIFSGTGAGQPLGFMNSAALITVSAESGQAASTIVAANVLKMMARLPARSVMNSVWLINQDILPQLWSMTVGSGSATHLMYAPPGLTNDNANAPWGTLMGRPVIPVEYASTLGTTGDIALVDLTQYIGIDKGGAQAAESMHVRFIYDEMAFRLTYRFDGQPAWHSPMTPYKGSNTQSPFVVLATR